MACYFFKYLAVICVLLPVAGNAQTSGRQSYVVNVNSFGALPNDGKDDTPGILAALDYCKKHLVRKMVLPGGRYDFWPERAWEEYMSISNNDEGLKRIAFPLANMNNFEIDGQGSELVFKGYICPFVIKKSGLIVLKNFSIDYTCTFHSEGKIIAVYKDSIDVSFNAQFPFKIQNGRLIFTGEKGEVFPYGHLLEFDSLKMETAYMASDYWAGPDIPVRDIGRQKVRLYLPGIKGTPGNILVFGELKRPCPAITITDSKRTRVSDIQIYHSGSMGIIGQRSADIVLQKVKVIPAPNSDRVVSVPADATHFVNCTGSITMDSCVFENQLDDATNIHGIYARISNIISPYEIEVQLVHELQFGFDLLTSGDPIEFVHPSGMITFNKGSVKQAKRLKRNIRYSCLKSR